MDAKEKKTRILRQIAIFGTVLVVFVIYALYRLKTGDLG
jgi:hypothetical protein